MLTYNLVVIFGYSCCALLLSFVDFFEVLSLLVAVEILVSCAVLADQSAFTHVDELSRYRRRIFNAKLIDI